MALIHYLYIGHFVPEQGFVQFREYLFAVTRSVDTESVARLIQKRPENAFEPQCVPASWSVTVRPEYIVCDYYGSPLAALQFVADYAEQTGAIIVDFGSFSTLTPEQLRASAARHADQRALVAEGSKDRPEKRGEEGGQSPFFPAALRN